MHYKTFLFPLTIFTLLFFAYLHSAPVFADPDSFYHARLTALMIEKKWIVTEFPWLPFTTLSDNYADHHFLYHLFLVPFIALFGPLWGIKIASTLAATAVIAVFWLFTWRLAPPALPRKKAFLVSLFTLSLFFNETFLLRLNLEKIPAMSILWLIGGVYALFSTKPKMLFAFSFFYVWLHSAWPLLPMLSLFTRKRALICASFAGALAGIIINPYFPQNIWFYLIQIYHIAVITYDKILPVGAEWRSPGLRMLVWNLPSVFMYMIGTILFFARPVFPPPSGKTKKSRDEWLFFFVSTFFLILTFKSARHGEYFAPFATLFAALIFLPYLSAMTLEKIKQKTLAFLSRGFFPVFCALVFAVLFIFVLSNAPWTVSREFIKGQTIEKYRGSAEFLKQKSAATEIIFNARWDSFYPLWYFNQKNRYISGFDPTFLYMKNPELFWAYERIASGAAQKDVAKQIRTLFGASFIVAEKENKPLMAVLEKDADVKKLYEDEYVSVFFTKPPSSPK